MISFMRSAFLLVDTDMVTPQAQRGIGLPLIHTIQRTLSGKGLDVFHDRFRVVRCNRQRLDITVGLDDAKDDDLAGSIPAAFVLSIANSSGFIAFQLTIEGLAQLPDVGAAGTQKPIEALRCRTLHHFPESADGRPVHPTQTIPPVFCAIEQYALVPCKPGLVGSVKKDTYQEYLVTQ